MTKLGTFFRQKLFSAPKVETLKMARYIQIFRLSALNLINQRNLSHIKLSKYCGIDARLGLFNGINTFQIQCLDDVDFFERIKIVQENLR